MANQVPFELEFELCLKKSPAEASGLGESSECLSCNPELKVGGSSLRGGTKFAAVSSLEVYSSRNSPCLEKSCMGSGEVYEVPFVRNFEAALKEDRPSVSLARVGIGCCSLTPNFVNHLKRVFDDVLVC